MTRSNDPFEDLPEWKERRRLQEIERLRQGGAPAREGYADAAPGWAQDGAGAYGFGGGPETYGAAGYGVPGGWPEPDAPASTAPTYEQIHRRPAPDYDAAYGRAPGHAPPQRGPLAGPHPGHGAPEVSDVPGSGFEPAGYEPDGRYAPGQNYAPIDDWGRTGSNASVGRAPLPPHAGYAAAGHLEPPAAPYDEAGGYDPALRGGQFDDGSFVYPGAAAAEPSLTDYRPNATRDIGYGAPPPFFGDDRAPTGRPYDQRMVEAPNGEADDYEEDDDYDDYDDYEEEGRRYGWKTLAAFVAAGVVVVGGGVVAFSMFAGGGGDGPAPIIKADHGPAKTAPADPGGRTFANQDSKLLGRLDSGGDDTGTARVDPDQRSRVREVPTVRVAPDGRLILPSEPQSAPAAPSSEGTGAPPHVPGINIVDSLSGGRGSGLDSLPPVIPKSDDAIPRATAAQPAIVNAPGAAARASSPEAPIIRNGGSSNSRSANLATARGGEPPVPQKSALSTGWRMTGPAQPQATRPAEPVVPAASATTTASTLGASSIAQGGTRAYVAVIATRATRMEALESFAELQQRHPQALSNRVPTVEAADLRSRGLGTMYRLLVGPAGSRQAANEVCASLKAGGYNGCWVKAN